MTFEAIRNSLTPCFYTTLVLESYWGKGEFPSASPQILETGSAPFTQGENHPLHEEYVVILGWKRWGSATGVK